jgi:hypothetical protein
MRGHQANRLGARRRILFHIALAIQLITRVQNILKIPRADQLFDLRFAQSAIQIDLLRLDAVFAKPTLRFAAGGSSGLEIEFHPNIVARRRRS